MSDKKIIEEIQLHCGDVQARIRACRSRIVAEALKERLCAETQNYCASPVVKNVLVKHVENIINATFDEKGHNIYLEET